MPSAALGMAMSYERFQIVDGKIELTKSGRRIRLSSPSLTAPFADRSDRKERSTFRSYEIRDTRRDVFARGVFDERDPDLDVLLAAQFNASQSRISISPTELRRVRHMTLDHVVKESDAHLEVAAADNRLLLSKASSASPSLKNDTIVLRNELARYGHPGFGERKTNPLIPLSQTAILTAVGVAAIVALLLLTMHLWTTSPSQDDPFVLRTVPARQVIQPQTELAVIDEYGRVVETRETLSTKVVTIPGYTLSCDPGELASPLKIFSGPENPECKQELETRYGSRGRSFPEVLRLYGPPIGIVVVLTWIARLWELYAEGRRELTGEQRAKVGITEGPSSTIN